MMWGSSYGAKSFEQGEEMNNELVPEIHDILKS